MNYRLIIFLILFFCQSYANAQHAEIDSLLSKYKYYFHVKQNFDSTYYIMQEIQNKSIADNYPFGEAKSYFVMGYIDMKRNNLDQAIINYLKAIDVYNKINDEKSLREKVKIHLNLGAIYANRFKDQNLAISFYLEGIKQAKQINDIWQLQSLYNNISICYQKKGDYNLAHNAIYEMLSITEEFDIVNLLDAYNRLGLINIADGNFESARNWFDKMLKIENASLNKKAQAYHNIGNTYFDESNYEKAISSYLKSIEIKESNDYFNKDLFDNNLVIAYNALANTELQRLNFQKAIQYLDLILDEEKHQFDSLRFQQDFFYAENYLRTIELKGICYENLHHANQNIEMLLSAAKVYQYGIHLIEQSREVFRNFGEGAMLRDLYQDIFGNMIHVNFLLHQATQETKYLRDMYRYLEMSKSYDLYQSINRNEALQHISLPDSMLHAINETKEEISLLHTKIAKLDQLTQVKPSDSIQVVDLKLSLIEKESFLKEYILLLEQNYPEYYEVNYGRKIITIEQTQQKLRPNEALLSYYEADDYLYLFTILQDTVMVDQLGGIPRDAINVLIKSTDTYYVRNYPDEAYEEFLLNSKHVYDQILAKPLSRMAVKGIDKLYIIPDRELNYLSFDMLLEFVPEDHIVGFYNELPLLIKKYSISYGYSASILFKEKRKIDYNGKILAMAPSYKSLFSDSLAFNRLGRFRNSFIDLDFNREEIENIGQYYRSDLLKNEIATEKAFLDRKENYDILHFAMHSMVDTDNPIRSKLVFHSENETGEDNFLHNFELYNMQIPTKMAVLSACSTGDGELAIGEGVMSMARAFTYAGAESVVMSQWKAGDKSASKIMSSFYQHLSTGMNKDVALRQAKLDYLANVTHHFYHPAHWSNFVIVGDVSPIPRIFRWYEYWWYLLGLIPVVMIWILIIIKKRRFESLDRLVEIDQLTD